MKRIIRFNLLLTILIAFFALSATPSVVTDKNKSRKPKKSTPTIALVRDTSNCANYYETEITFKQGKHNVSCPAGCQDPHLQTIEGKKTLKTCPKGKLYNPRKLACDFPENVVTCIHTPKCTNE